MRSINQPAVDARLLAEARAGYRWLVRLRLIVDSKEAWQAFLAGYLAMENFYRARDAMRSAGHVA